jgi:hypothetical protein
MTRRLDPRALIALGLSLLAIRAALQGLVDRIGPHRDFTDFALGLLFGIGLGVSILGMWRMKRDRSSPGA